MEEIIVDIYSTEDDGVWVNKQAHELEKGYGIVRLIRGVRTITFSAEYPGFDADTMRLVEYFPNGTSTIQESDAFVSGTLVMMASVQFTPILG